jgi:hypothetical protein
MTILNSSDATFTLSDLYRRWDLIAMAIAMGVVFGFEMFGVFSARYVTITAIVRAFVPMWLRWMIWGWLGWHFLLPH